MTRALSSMLLLAAVALAPVPAAYAQDSPSSLAAVRSALAPGDAISIVPADGAPLTGRLLRVGESDLAIRVVAAQRFKDVSLTWDAIQSLERHRDPVTNGALIGGGVGAGIFGVLLGTAVAVDRNEMDEWAPGYAAVGAVIIGLGTALGATIDFARSKPRLRFDRRAAGTPAARIGAPRRPALGVTVSF